MAGNTIYMQEGSNYIDIHDNEVVNLSEGVEGTGSCDPFPSEEMELVQKS